MGVSKSELKRIWNMERNHYTHSEIGSGTQKFVKKVLCCSELFNLKEGLLSTQIEKRKMEFIEEISKDGNIADLIIFINKEVIIPVEVEKYKNIVAGEKQILQYQLDWDKKYGILTDGYTWRFYNNNIFHSYTLDFMLIHTNDFFIFWNSYIKEENYYLYFLQPLNNSDTFSCTNLSVEDNKSSFFIDITYLIRQFKNRLNISNYFQGGTLNEKEKWSSEISYAYIIQFILYKVLVDNDFNNYREDFTTRIESIYNAIIHGSFTELLLKTQGISRIISDIYRPFLAEQRLISDQLDEIIYQAKNTIEDVIPWLDIIVFIKKYNFSNINNEIFGFIYENYLKELYEDSQKGQFFTDSTIVNYMLDLLGYTADNIKNNIDKINSLSIIDPSCGSGTFLYSATNRLVLGSKDILTPKQIIDLVSNDIFGLDISEFPLYLAEMNILMRLLPLIMNYEKEYAIKKKIKVFKTNDSIAEFMDTRLYNTRIDLLINHGEQLYFLNRELNLGYSSYVRDEHDLDLLKKSLEINEDIPRRRFDYVIGNPPYISYNDCCKQNLLTFQLIKGRKIRLNNIYGVNLHSVPGNPKKYRPNPNLYSFFIALGLALLKDGGKLCYIIPQTILINPDLDVIRYHLAKYSTIKKMILFNYKMFTDRGITQGKSIPTSSMILLLERTLPDKFHSLEIISYVGEAKEVQACIEDINNGENIQRKIIPQNKLLDNINDWLFIIRSDKPSAELYENYKKSSDSIRLYYKHTLAEKYFSNRFYFDGGYSINEKNKLETPLKDIKNYRFPVIDDSRYGIHSFSGFWPNIRNSDHSMSIKLRQCNQSYSLLDSTYKIIWSYNNTNKFHFTTEPVIWARNTLLGIGSENYNEMLYIFAILNSSVTRSILDQKVRIENEDTKTILVSLQIIKNQIRIPIINVENVSIKEEIIKSVKMLLSLEDLEIKDCVDFSKITLLQKADKVIIHEDKMILFRNTQSFECNILSNKTLLAKELNKPDFADNMININRLLSQKLYDADTGNLLKRYIDDLVFSLYFKVYLPHIGFCNAKKVHDCCQNNKYYPYIEQYKE